MSVPLAWVRRIASELPELASIPLFGNSPPFDWNRLSSSIGKRLDISQLAFHPREQVWREEAEIGKNLGPNLLTIPLAISPLGTAFWIMSREDMIKLTSWMMKSASKGRPLSSEILQEGFYRYLILEALDVIQEIGPLKDLTLQLSEEGEGLLGKAFCIDVEIHLEQKSCWGRLAIPVELRSAWVQHFSHMQSEYIPAEIARQTQLVMGVKVGSVLLRQGEWEEIREGDFLLLDQGSYDAHKGTGMATLMLQSTPIFNAKIKHNKIELVDYAFYYEDTMEQRDQKQERGAKLSPAEEEAVTLKELTLPVTVEIARLKITLDQLMHLTPGNMLELPIHPDQGVSLTINGQKVGRAELVYLGEQLGLRILEIG